MNGLHDDVVVSIGASRDDVLRLLPEEPKRDAGDGHAAARSDGQRKEALAPFKGPKFAIDAEGNESPVLAAHLSGVQRHTIPGVSHWLMLDDPAAFNEVLDEVLAVASVR